MLAIIFCFIKLIGSSSFTHPDVLQVCMSPYNESVIFGLLATTNFAVVHNRHQHLVGLTGCEVIPN